MEYYRYCYSTELYHHGIKGMKWGVRRFQREDGSRTSLGLRREQRLNERADKAQLKADNANTRFGRVRYGLKANRLRYKADRKKSIRESTSFGEKFSNKYGYKSAARRNEYASKGYKIKAKNARTKLGRAYNSAASYNTESASRAYKTASKKVGLTNKIAYKNLTLYGTRSIETIGGRHVNAGSYAVNAILSNAVPTIGSIYSLGYQFKGYSKNRK